MRAYHPAYRSCATAGPTTERRHHAHRYRPSRREGHQASGTVRSFDGVRKIGGDVLRYGLEAPGKKTVGPRAYWCLRNLPWPGSLGPVLSWMTGDEDGANENGRGGRILIRKPKDAS